MSPLDKLIKFIHLNHCEAEMIGWKLVAVYIGRKEKRELQETLPKIVAGGNWKGTINWLTGSGPWLKVSGMPVYLIEEESHYTAGFQSPVSLVNEG